MCCYLNILTGEEVFFSARCDWAGAEEWRSLVQVSFFDCNVAGWAPDCFPLFPLTSHGIYVLPCGKGASRPARSVQNMVMCGRVSQSSMRHKENAEMVRESRFINLVARHSMTFVA